MFSTRSLLIAAAAVGTSMLAAGCGGSSTPAAGTGHRSVLAYSRCMHAHGIANFPDPNPQGGIDKNQIIALGNSPQMNAASTACAHVMPTSGLGPSQAGPPPHARFADALAFARCVRRHGFPTFPDPTSSGQLTAQMISGAGIDVHQPAALRAGDACVGASHGAITRASVARVVAGS